MAGTLANADTGIPYLRYPEHPGFGELWRYAKETPRDGIKSTQESAYKSIKCGFFFNAQPDSSN
jgi:hypothetical protein